MGMRRPSGGSSVARGVLGSAPTAWKSFSLPSEVCEGDSGSRVTSSSGRSISPRCFPAGGPTTEPQSCLDANSKPPAPPEPEAFLSSPISERHWIRNIAPPEFGDKLANLLSLSDKAIQNSPSSVKRGAELFG